MYQLKRSKPFIKSLKKLSGIEQVAVERKLDVLAEDPSHPSLRTKRYHKVKGWRESSVNMSIRILWMLEGDKIILLHNVGHHDIL